MEKILIIKGSNRKNGYTEKICNEIIKAAGEENVQVFDSFNASFKPCDGCNYCEEKGECRHRDLDAFFDSFEKADTVVFVSPVYNGTFSAPVKALIDRFQVYYTWFYKNGKVQKINKRRKGVLIAVSGRDGKDAFQYMKSQLKFAFSILNIEFTNSFLCSGTDTLSDYDSVICRIKKEFNV
jgi:multimeric flavodoxin WrbA